MQGIRYYLLFCLLVLGITVGSGYAEPAKKESASVISELKKELEALKSKVKILEERLEQETAKTAPAVPAGATPPISPEQYQELDQKIKILERKQEIDMEAAKEKAKVTPILGAGKDGFSLKSPEGDYQLKLRGYMQTDGRFFLNDNDHQLNDSLLLRRVRPIFEGTLFKDFDFRIMPDFGGGTATLYDAYVNIHFWPEATIQIGKFKPPVGFERLQSATNLGFVERAFPTNLAPNRDVGVQLGGDLLDGSLSYAVGLFNGVPDGGNGDLDVGDSKDFAGRIFTLPFKTTEIEALQDLGFGVAGSYGTQIGNLATYKSPGQVTIFSYDKTAAADGDRYRLSPQGYYYWNSFGLLGEYIFSTQEVAKGAAFDRVENDAWQIQASYILTGEKASYKGVKPKKPLSFKNGTWGAFELVSRYSRFNVDEDVFLLGLADAATSVRDAEEWAGGLNWYLNNNVKFSIDFSHTDYSGGKKGGLDRESENAVFTQIQTSF